MRFSKMTLFTLFVFAFAACQNAEKPKAQENNLPPAEMESAETGPNYSAMGDSISSASQMALGKQLKMAMQRGGVKEAVSFCNIEALPLTDSLSKHFNATIKRATEKTRNPANQATTEEANILAIWQTKMDNEGAPNPVLFEEENAVHYYRPILIQPLCTTCHGEKGKTLTVENEQFIKEKYPQDEATGYRPGDLRGMWHITFEK